MVSGTGQAPHPRADMVPTHHLWWLWGHGDRGVCLPAPCPQQAVEGPAVGLERFAMGLGTRRAPLTAPAPAKSKGQHLFGGGGQCCAQGPWHGCLTAGH